MPKRKKLTTSKDSKKIKKKFTVTQKDFRHINRLYGKKNKSTGKPSKKTYKLEKIPNKEINNKSINLAIINTKNQEKKIESNNYFENNLIEIKKEKNLNLYSKKILLPKKK